MAQSRDFEYDEGEVTFDFQMQRAASLTGQLVDANGRPASGAKLAISDHGSQISIQDGRFDDSSTYATRLVADEKGQFRVPAREAPFHLAVLHEQGHALLFSESIDSDAPVELKPWSSIEGTYRIGSKPAANLRLRIDLNEFHSDHPIGGRIFASAIARTDERGRYRHSRLFDESTIVAREIIMMVDDGAREVASTPRIPITLDPGEHRILDIGGSGSVAVGQLRAPIAHDMPIHWKLASVYVSRHLVAPVPPVDRKTLNQKPGQWEAWLRTPEGLGFLASSKTYKRERSKSIRYYATVGPDGVFQINDIPAGEYELRADLGEGQKGTIRNHRFSVPSTEDEQATGAVDLGIIQLE
ncbi:hypothetical protein [Rhodopirellula sp. P2]|uniref:hypothetical protein n=1 Tax=Rhodopirellula sp. P2 TaxID=2127060 RepID=UPI0023683195|nr:hypothetical protein [Rhodopirellula sp. P2]WDQ15360.1 hypothetical protein PSR62_17155 [Rhodopirellula sp. P2]